jgi:hypothetical protein
MCCPWKLVDQDSNVPAFFSCNVNSAQLTFMRSLSAIHNSACSCGGIASHLFSIFASVGLEIACAWRLWTIAAGVDRTTAAARELRIKEVRNMAGDGDLVVQKRGEFNWDIGLRRLCSCGRGYEQLAGRDWIRRCSLESRIRKRFSRLSFILDHVIMTLRF